MAAPSMEALRARRLRAPDEPCYVACLALAARVAACAHNSSSRCLIGACFVLPTSAVRDSLQHCILRYRRLFAMQWSGLGVVLERAEVQRPLGPFGMCNFESFDMGCERPATPLASSQRTRPCLAHSPDCATGRRPSQPPSVVRWSSA
jgi:hypothetical protein